MSDDLKRQAAMFYNSTERLDLKSRQSATLVFSSIIVFTEFRSGNVNMQIHNLFLSETIVLR